MNRLKIGLGLIASLWAISAMPASAAAPPALRESVAVCDPNSPTHCAAPNSSGALPITGNITASNASVGLNAATAPTSSTELGTVDEMGNLQAVSATNPVPISGSVTADNASVGATGSPVPASVTYIGGSRMGTLLGLSVNTIGQITIANTAFTANAGTDLNTSYLALAATQMDGTQKTQIVDGSDNVIASTDNALNVQCVNCSSPSSRTIVALDISTITTGGTAVDALDSGHRTAGGWLLNPIGATVALCINEQGTASGTTSSGATTCIQPGQTYTLQPTSGAVSVISSDSSHPFSGMGLN